MAKRFHDTEIWDEDWFIALPRDYRDFYLFIKDKCDHAGIYRPNIAKFNKLYDCNVTAGKTIELINNGKQRIEVLDNNRWLLPDFISFQYGNHLNINNRVHASILRVLESNGVNLRSIRGLIEDTQGVKDKDKDKDKDNIKRIVKGKNSTAQEIYDYYAKTIKAGGKEDAIRSITRLPKEGLTKKDLLDRIDAYKASILKNNIDSKYFIQANNFFGRQARYKDFEPQESKFKEPDPDCKACQGTGFVYNQAKSVNNICGCRLISGSLS